MNEPQRTICAMERVTGIGGVFMRSKDPEALAPDTDYFGRREQGWMVNFRVRDLDAMLTQPIRAVEPAPDTLRRP